MKLGSLSTEPAYARADAEEAAGHEEAGDESSPEEISPHHDMSMLAKKAVHGSMNRPDMALITASARELAPSLVFAVSM